MALEYRDMWEVLWPDTRDTLVSDGLQVLCNVCGWSAYVRCMEPLLAHECPPEDFQEPYPPPCASLSAPAVFHHTNVMGRADTPPAGNVAAGRDGRGEGPPEALHSAFLNWAGNARYTLVGRPEATTAAMLAGPTSTGTFMGLTAECGICYTRLTFQDPGPLMAHVECLDL